VLNMLTPPSVTIFDRPISSLGRLFMSAPE